MFHSPPANTPATTSVRPASAAPSLAGVLLLLWFARRPLLLAFAGVLLAVFLSTLASVLHERARVPYRVR